MATVNGFSHIIKTKLENVRKFVKGKLAYIQQVTQNGYIYYGLDDRLPNQIVDGINNSGTATNSVKRLRQFIEAEGFKDEYTNKFRVNKSQTFKDLLSDIVENETKLEGFALRLYFNLEGNIAKIYSLPIPSLRRKDKGHFLYNPSLGESNRNTAEDEIIREFDPTLDPKERKALIAEEIRKHEEQLGEVYYCYRKKLGRNYQYYPVPDFFSGFDDIISDGKISELELRNIVNGWRAGIVLSTGVIDNENEDTHGMTQLDYFNEQVSDFLGEDASDVIHLMARTPEEQPTVTVLPIKDLVDMTEKATIRLGEKVSRLMGVPPILNGFAKQGQLGNVQELKNTMSLFYLSIIGRQNWITEKLDFIKDFIEGGEGIEFELSRLNPFDFLPESVLTRLSDREIREYFELPIIEEELLKSENTNEVTTQAIEVNEHLKSLTGKQQQQIDRINRKFQKDQLTEMQALIQLTSGFGFTEDEAKKYLGIEILEEDGNDNIK